MDSQTGLPLGFEFVDIEIINHKKQNEVKNEKWHCDSCSLFFLSEEKLALHKKTHLKKEDVVNCKYCDKILTGEEGKECYSNRKCETCEYRCSQCPQRFLRQSSLTNHEKNHSVKKRRITSAATSKKQVDEDGGQINDVPKKRRYTRVNLEDSSTNTDLDSSKLVSSPRRKRKRELDEPNSEKIVAATKKTLSLSLSNRRTSRRSLPDKDLPVNESVNSTSPIAPTNGSAIENTVTYKPFSCHVCGENFASDSVLLSHIKTHGETAAKAFKCKYCGDKFSDIYKMQYHLAICPLAEDELESSLVKSCPPKTSPKKPISGSPRLTNGDSLSRKRGKPRKYMDSDSCDENEESTTPNRTRSSISKRKSDAVNLSSTKVTNSSSSGKMNRSARGARGTSEVVGNATEDEGEGGTQDPLKITSGLGDENKRKMHQCPHPSCELKFTREKAMLCHYRNHEDYDGTVKCFKCGIPFDDDQDLSAHIKECKGIKEEKDDDYSDPLDTSQNDDIYYDEEDLHGVTKNIRGNYMCKICGKTYMTNDGLDRCLHEDPAESERNCRLCVTKCVNEIQLVQHFQDAHPQSLPYLCLMCSAEFESNTRFSKHKSTHKDEDIQCLLCSMKFDTYNDLHFHHSKDHVNKKHYICKICNKNFKSDQLLQVHKKSHKDMGRFECMECGKVFRDNEFLRMHMKRHTDNELLTCRICYKTFLDDSTTFFEHMELHVNSKNDEPFTCCLCHLSFKIKPALRTHIANYHLGKQKTLEKCPVCNFQSLKILTMTLHLLGHSSTIAGRKTTLNNNKLQKSEDLQGGGSNCMKSSVNDNHRKITTARQKTLEANKVSKNQIPVVNVKSKETDEIQKKKVFAKRVNGAKELEKRTPVKGTIKRKNLVIATDKEKKTPVKGTIKRKNLVIGTDKEDTDKEDNCIEENLDDDSCNKEDIDCDSFNEDIDLEDTLNGSTGTKLDHKNKSFTNSKCTLNKEDLLNNSSNKESVGKVKTYKRGRPMSFISFASKTNTYSSPVIIKGENDIQIDSSHTDNISIAGNKKKVSSRPRSLNSPGRSHTVAGKSDISGSPDLFKKGSKNLEPIQKTSRTSSSSFIKAKNNRKCLPNNGNFKNKNTVNLNKEFRKENKKSINNYTADIQKKSNPNFNNTSKVEITNEIEISPIKSKFKPKSDIKTEEFIKEGKFFEPSPRLAKNSCTTCLMTFDSQEELFNHIAVHI